MESDGKSSRRRRLKVCCGISLIFLVILIVVLIILYFTIFKPKQPIVQAQPATLQHVQVLLTIPPQLNVTLGLVLTVKNRNYGGFKYKDSTAYVYYYGEVVAEAPIENGLLPARSTRNISSSVVILGDRLLSIPKFWVEVFQGQMNFTSSVELSGKASFLKIIKVNAKASTKCNIAVNLGGSIDSECDSKISI
ncbi:hypothetical protein ACLOJK_029498 [Asimina triloba]